MGAGSGPAGLAPAGYDPTTLTPAIRYEQTQAVRYDVKTRNLLRDPNTGLLQTIHWVDQAVALALGVGQGTHGSVTELGNRLRAIKRAGGTRLQAEVRDAVQDTLQALLDGGHIAVTDLQIATPTRGQITVVVFYVNLRLPGTKLPKDVKLVF